MLVTVYICSWRCLLMSYLGLSILVGVPKMCVFVCSSVPCHWTLTGITPSFQLYAEQLLHVAI